MPRPLSNSAACIDAAKYSNFSCRRGNFLTELNNIHNNPVKRRLVNSPGNCRWSSWRYYFLQDASLVRMARRD